MALILTHSLGKVRSILRSVDEATFSPGQDESVLINPQLPPCEQRYMVVEGSSVREQTPAEKQADIDAAAAVQAAYEAKVAGYMNALSAKLDSMNSVAVALQSSINSFPASPTTAQLRSGLLTTAQNLVNLAWIISDMRPLFSELYRDWAGRQP